MEEIINRNKGELIMEEIIKEILYKWTKDNIIENKELINEIKNTINQIIEDYMDKHK